MNGLRHSIRLKTYDYTQSGMYYVTICVKNHSCLFGKIVDKKMILNNVGKMIEKWYFELMNKFPDICCGEYIIMPNHFHAIIVNIAVGADLCVRPNVGIVNNFMNAQMQNIANQQKHLSINNFCNNKSKQTPSILQRKGEHTGSPLHNVIQWFKTMTTNEYIRGIKQNNWLPFTGKLWQRNYYEHIIRNDKELNHITEYIKNNPHTSFRNHHEH